MHRTSITEAKNHLGRLIDQIGQVREHPRPPMWRRDFIPPKTLAESLCLAIRGGSVPGFRGLETRGHRPPMWRRDFIPPKTLAESLRLAIRGGSAPGFRGLETRGHMDGTRGHRPGKVLGLR
jgi:hypothetical protein